MDFFQTSKLFNHPNMPEVMELFNVVFDLGIDIDLVILVAIGIRMGKSVAEISNGQVDLDNPEEVFKFMGNEFGPQMQDMMTYMNTEFKGDTAKIVSLISLLFNSFMLDVVASNVDNLEKAMDEAIPGLTLDNLDKVFEDLKEGDEENGC